MRTPPHDIEHRRSTKDRGDRIANKPKTLRALLKWGQAAYAMEPPPRLHDRDTADDGTPAHSPQAQSYIGLSRPKWIPEDAPDDPKEIACRTDEDGFHKTPMRCAIERESVPERRALLKAVLPNVLFPSDAAITAGVPGWCVDEVLFRALSLLWDRFVDRPLPRRSPKSDAQLDAEAA